jgi:hypothetical protein
MLFLLGCIICEFLISKDSDGVACTDIAMASVMLSVVDEEGRLIRGSSASFAVDGERQGGCEGENGEFICGWEQAGEFEITASAEGFIASSRSITIEQTEDGCHVVGQELVIVLEREEVACTEEARPSVLVTLVSERELVRPQVMWGLTYADMAPQPCSGEGSFWVCGEEVAGSLDIYASANGTHAVMQTVEVPMTEDGCHVITQEIEIRL